MTDPAEEGPTEKDHQLQAPRGKEIHCISHKKQITPAAQSVRNRITLNSCFSPTDFLKQSLPTSSFFSIKQCFLLLWVGLAEGLVSARTSWIAVVCYSQMNLSFATKITGSFVFKANIVNSYIRHVTPNTQIALGTIRYEIRTSLCPPGAYHAVKDLTSMLNCISKKM